MPTLWPRGLAQSATFWTANIGNMKKLWDTITNAYVTAMGGNVKEHYLSPLTYSYSPGCNDPQGDAEDQKHCARADSHQSLHHKPCVKVHLMRNHKQTHKLTGSFDTAYFFSPRKFVCIHLHYSAMFTEVQLTEHHHILHLWLEPERLRQT